MPDMELLMVPQGIEIGRSDFGNEIRDRIAFEVCFAINTTCAGKKALLTLFYSTADSIIAATNVENTIWTRIVDAIPSPILGAVLFRYKRNPKVGWSIGLAIYQQHGMDGKWGIANPDGSGNWPEGSEWMAVPI